jgi:hypothetical protein
MLVYVVSMFGHSQPRIAPRGRLGVHLRPSPPPPDDAAGSPSQCGATALDGKPWLENKVAGAAAPGSWRRRTPRRRTATPRFGGYGGREGGMGGGPRCSRL